jgi:cytochrome c biogenesis protein ResB
MVTALRSTWRWLARTEVASFLLAVAIALLVVGSLFPQRAPPLTGDDSTHWQALIRNRYGAFAGPLTAAGAFWLFRSPLFVGWLALLSLATLACALNRWPALWRGALRHSARPPEALLDSAPHTICLTVSPSADLPARVRRCMHDHGFKVMSGAAGDERYVRGDRNSLARLATAVEHLAIVLLVTGMLASYALGWRMELTLAPGQSATLPGSNSFTARNVGFTIERYPDSSPADYEVQLNIADGTRSPVARVGVNRPLARSGVRLYLSGYQPTASGDVVTLLAVHDPGYLLIVAGGALLLLGMTIAIAFPHCSVHARLADDGTLRLAGFADRGALSFDRDFAGLAAALQTATVSDP